MWILIILLGILSILTIWNITSIDNLEKTVKKYLNFDDEMITRALEELKKARDLEVERKFKEAEEKIKEKGLIKD